MVAALTAGAVVFALEAVAPAAPSTRGVVVAATDLASGHLLTPDDLVLVQWPADLVPEGAITTAEVAVGRVLAGAVGRREAVTALRLAGPAVVEQLARTDLVAVPVRITDGEVAGLVRPGDRVDVVAAQVGGADPVGGGIGAPSAQVVATAATVLTVPAPVTGESFAVGSPASAGALVVLAVTRPQALALAEAVTLGPISVILVNAP